jgi:hypothetical protein
VLGTPVFEENSSVDLSSNGISFETEREYQKGALILLEVYLPEEALKLLVCVAWVKRLEGDLFQVGAELVAVDPVHKRKMQSHLKKMIQTFATKRVSAKKRRPKKPALKKKKSSKKKISKKKVAKKKVTTKRRS